jgi:RNA polymerase sigma-70 factor (ECF subfamily)
VEPRVATRAELDDWVIAVAPRAVAYARNLCKDAHQAEDVVQACFCRLLAKAGDYDLPIDGERLMMKAITNAIINLKTRRRPFLRLVCEQAGEEVSLDPPDLAAILPEVFAATAELSEAVIAGLKQLPETQRAAVELKAMGYSQHEIGDMLSTTATNAGVLIYRARQALTVHLSAFLDGEAVR